MNVTPLREITTEEIATYHRDGVVWLKAIIDPEWATRMGKAIDAAVNDEHGFVLNLTNYGLQADEQGAVAQRPADDHFHRTIEARPDEGAAHWDDPTYLRGTVLLDDEVGTHAQRGQFLSMHETWHSMPFIRELAHASPLPEIAATLMASETANLYGDQILIKPPLTRERTAWHADVSYEYIEGDQVIGLRVVADEEDETLGSVEYLRGSHRDGTVYKCTYFISALAAEKDPGADIPDIESNKAGYDVVQFAPRPGDIVVHHLRCLHGAGGNRSASRTRRATTVRYCGDDVRFKFRPWAPPSNRPPLEDGDPLTLAPETYPQCWPREID